MAICAKGGYWRGDLASTGLIDIVLLIIIENRKAILFYIGVLPGFCNVTRATTGDTLVLGLVSAVVQFCGNII